VAGVFVVMEYGVERVRGTIDRERKKKEIREMERK
jgi:hypothetical protein